MSPPATTNSRSVCIVGIAWWAASSMSRSIRLFKKRSLPTSNAPLRAWTRLTKAACLLNGRIAPESGRRSAPLRCQCQRGLMHRSKRVALFNDFIGRSRESHRYLDAQRPGGLEIEDKFVFDRLHHWQLTGLLTLEDASDVDAGLTIGIDDTSSIACQTASIDILAAVVHDRQLMACGD